MSNNGRSINCCLFLNLSSKLCGGRWPAADCNSVQTIVVLPNHTFPPPTPSPTPTLHRGDSYSFNTRFARAHHQLSQDRYKHNSLNLCSQLSLAGRGPRGVAARPTQQSPRSSRNNRRAACRPAWPGLPSLLVQGFGWHHIWFGNLSNVREDILWLRYNVCRGFGTGPPSVPRLTGRMLLLWIQAKKFNFSHRKAFILFGSLSPFVIVILTLQRFASLNFYPPLKSIW